MKKITLTLALIGLFGMVNTVSAQDKVKKEINKQVNVEHINGEKVLTIKTMENGKTITQVYKGEEANKKMEELSKEKSGTTKSMVVGEDGKEHMEIKKKVIIKK